MKNYQKGSANVVLVIVVIILLGVIAYLYFKKPGVVNETPNTTQNVETNTSMNTETVTPTSNEKTYTSTAGFSFNYPTNATMKKTMKTNGFDEVISFNVPFETNYTKYTGKTFLIQNYNGSCEAQSPGLTGASTKRTVNGVEYYYSNPEWTATSGMSSISYYKKYILERNSKCFTFSEYITGTGTNETPPGATAPTNVQAFFDSEMNDLDAIMASVTWFK